MNKTVHNKIISFIWSIEDDCFRYFYEWLKYKKEDPDGRKLPPFFNLGLRYVFEEPEEESEGLITNFLNLQ